MYDMINYDKLYIYLNDKQIVLLRAAVIRARKDLDEVTAEISEQASVISTAQGKNTPAETLLSYKKALKCLIDQGESKLTNFTEKNGSLVERLEMLVLTAPEGSELHTKATSLRDRLVGEAVSYRGKFRKLKVEHESLLTGVGGSGSASSS